MRPSRLFMYFRPCACNVRRYKKSTKDLENGAILGLWLTRALEISLYYEGCHVSCHPPEIDNKQACVWHTWSQGNSFHERLSWCSAVKNKIQKPLVIIRTLPKIKCDFKGWFWCVLGLVFVKSICFKSVFPLIPFNRIKKMKTKTCQYYSSKSWSF